MIRALAGPLAFALCLTPPAVRAQAPPPGPQGGVASEVMSELLGRAERVRQPGFQLTPEEQKASEHLKRLQREDIAQYKRTKIFPAATAFYKGKDAIEISRSFGALKKMPKGAALHLHSIAAGRARWIVYNASARPNCYVYWPGVDAPGQGGHVKGELGFFKPGGAPPGFRSVTDVRGSVPDFDRQLLELLTLGPEDETVPDIWTEFGKCIQRVGSLLSYQPVFIDYFVDAFEMLVADGVDYVEIRTGLGRLFDLQDNSWTGERFIEQYLEVRRRVREKHPDFDFKLIVAGSRYSAADDIKHDLVALLPMRLKYPEFVIGYDLVGEEDGGEKTAYYFPVLAAAVFLYELSSSTLPFYLHDGETNWRESSNIRYCLLLKTRRIGHGLNLYLFPKLEQHFIRERIPLEICPISNQMLRYVSDLRLHPANGYLRKGVTCVISSDDPGVFGYEGLTYDFWEAFMAWELELIDLKQLALNSIDFSDMTGQEKQDARAHWQREWDRFIRELNR